MQKWLLPVLLLFVPVYTSADAVNLSKNEMIKEADAIVVADIEAVEKTAKVTSNWTYRQMVAAKVLRTIKGDVNDEITIYGDETFICERCYYSTGKHILFLNKEDDYWVGSNWQEGIRPITGDQVEWFVDGGGKADMSMQQLDDVLQEIEGVLQRDAENGASLEQMMRNIIIPSIEFKQAELYYDDLETEKWLQWWGENMNRLKKDS